jgi:hypothetical protein
LRQSRIRMHKVTFPLTDSAIFNQPVMKFGEDMGRK